LQLIFNSVPFDDVKTRLTLFGVSKNMAQWMQPSSIAMMAWLQSVLPSKEALNQQRIIHRHSNALCLFIYQQTSSTLMLKLIRYLIKDMAFKSAYFHALSRSIDALKANPSSMHKFIASLNFIVDHYTYRYQINTENGAAVPVNNVNPRGDTLLENIFVCHREAPWATPLLDCDVTVVGDLPKTPKEQNAAMCEAIEQEYDQQKKELMRFYLNNSQDNTRDKCFLLTSHKREIREAYPDDFFADVLYKNQPIYDPVTNQIKHLSCITTPESLAHLRKTVMMDVTKDRCQKKLINRINQCFHAEPLYKCK
jgi:hypothetical protein